jgi:hypothetical protein
MGTRIPCDCGKPSSVSMWIKDRWVQLCMDCRVKRPEK